MGCCCKRTIIFITIIYCAILSLLLSSGCQSINQTSVTDKYCGQILNVKAGKEFTVKISSQTSTGYRWKITEMPASIQLINETVITKEDGIVGAEDIQVFNLKAIKEGDYKLILNYAQHWRKNPTTVKNTVIRIIIAGK